MKANTRNLLLIFCGLLILVIFILYGYSATVRGRNTVLKAENVALQAKYNQLLEKSQPAKKRTVIRGPVVA